MTILQWSSPTSQLEHRMVIHRLPAGAPKWLAVEQTTCCSQDIEAKPLAYVCYFCRSETRSANKILLGTYRVSLSCYQHCSASRASTHEPVINQRYSDDEVPSLYPSRYGPQRTPAFLTEDLFLLESTCSVCQHIGLERLRSASHTDIVLREFGALEPVCVNIAVQELRAFLACSPLEKVRQHSFGNACSSIV